MKTVQKREEGFHFKNGKKQKGFFFLKVRVAERVQERRERAFFLSNRRFVESKKGRSLSFPLCNPPLLSRVFILWCNFDHVVIYKKCFVFSLMSWILFYLAYSLHGFDLFLMFGSKHV